MPNFPLYVWILLVVYGMIAVPYIEWAGRPLDLLSTMSEEAQKLKQRGKTEEYKQRMALLRLTFPSLLFLIISICAFAPAFLLAFCAELALRLHGGDIKTMRAGAPEMYWLSTPLLPFVGPFLLVIALIGRIFHSPKPKKTQRRLVSAR